MPSDEESFQRLQVHLTHMPPDRLDMLDEVDEATEASEIIFSEPVDAFVHSPSLPLLCLIYDDNRLIRFFGVGRRGSSAGTGLTQMEIAGKQKLASPLALDDLLAELPSSFMGRAHPIFKTGGLLPLKTSHAVLRALLTRDPAAQNMIRRALSSRWSPLANLSSDELFAFQQQQDAVLTSLALAGLDRRRHLEFVLDPNSKPKSFIDLLSVSRLREDPMVVHDYQQLPGFLEIKRYVQNAVRFTDGRTVLTVLLINRQPLETLTGTDLVYFNETYKSFVMVQYKAMEKEDEEEVFRLPNEKLDEEINRMRDLSVELGRIPAKSDGPTSFRFNNSPFFLKFCPRVIQDPEKIDLIPGMYFPLDYWTSLNASSLLDGPKGGKLLTYNNPGRYLTNSEFTTFVRKAWTGTPTEQSEVLEKVVLKTLETGKAVTVAQVRSETETDAESQTIENNDTGDSTKPACDPATPH